MTGRILPLCFLVTASVMTASALLNTALPTYVLALGGDHVYVGMLFAVTTGVSMVLRPVTGGWTDRYGARRVIVPGAIILGMTSTALYFTRHPALVVALMAGTGVSVGLVATAAGALVSRSAPPERRGEVLSVYYLATSVPIALGPMIALFIAKVSHVAAGFAVTGGAALLVIASAAMLPIGATASERRAAVGRGLVSRRNPTLVVTLILAQMGRGSLYGFLPLHAALAGLDNIGWFFALFSGSIIGCRIAFRKASDKWGRHRVLVPALAMIALGFFALALPPTLASLALAAVVMGFGHALLYPTLLALAVDRTPASEVGLTTGTMSASFDFGAAVGSAIVGVIVQYTSYGTGFALVAMLTTAALTTFVVSERRPHDATGRPDASINVPRTS